MAYLARSVANRGVHLRITPRPANLGETREILRLLSQFGEVDYFKSLKYDGQGLGLPSAGLVIYKDEEGAKNCFRGSPVRFRMGKVKAGGGGRDSALEEAEGVPERVQEETARDRGGAWGLGGAHTSKTSLGAPWGLEPEPHHQKRYVSTSSLPKPTPQPIRMPFDSPSPPDAAAQKSQDEDRIFQIITSPTNRNFRDQINMGPYHSHFAIDGKMPGQEDLAKRVPVLGMSCVDWRARDKPWRLVKREKDGRDKRERLGVLWERGVKDSLEITDGTGRHAIGKTASGEVEKWGSSWSDVGIR